MADPSFFQAPSSDVSAAPAGHEDLPDRLRVHSLARVLGTTSSRVLEALTELDGRVRSAHSSVDRVDAVRVRDLLVSADAASIEPLDEPGEPGELGEAGEPESRLLLETTAERAEYMPLFVAPQPVPAFGNDFDDTDSGVVVDV